MDYEDILRKARDRAPRFEQIYTVLHENPELGNREERTSALVAERLEACGWEVARPAGTAVVGLLRGAKPGRTVALRADMDALPVEEQTNLPCRSRVPGVMHACGHDLHTAGLLGAAEMLADHRGELCGNVKVFFQPDEEGNGGARRMIDAGCLEDPQVDAVFGAHVNPELPAGCIGLKYGKAYAASDMFTVVVCGKGCHGASPHEGIDALAVGAQLVSTLQSIVSRRIAPTDSAVVSVGSFHAGTAGNVLAETAELEGILRTLGQQTRRNVRRWFEETVRGVCAAMGAEAEIRIRESYPGVVNHDAGVNLVRAAAEGMLGPEHVILEDSPTMGTEDFGEFLLRVPGCFWHLGVRGDDPRSAEPLHSPRFAPDLRALDILIALHVAAAMDFLGR